MDDKPDVFPLPWWALWLIYSTCWIVWLETAIRRDTDYMEELA